MKRGTKVTVVRRALSEQAGRLVTKELRTIQIGTPVRIDWVDAWNSPGWKDKGQEKHLVGACITRGVVIENEETYICLAMTDNVFSTHNRFSIPFGCITGWREIE